MKTLTITLPDEVVEKLAAHAAENGHSAEAWAARALEDAYDDSWLADLSPEDRAAIEQGWEEAERGETIPHAQVVAELRQKFDW